jgi:lysophospholipase L1-like esterase
MSGKSLTKQIFPKSLLTFIENTTPPLPDYTHPNQLGHQLIAHYLFDQFIQKDYI